MLPRSLYSPYCLEEVFSETQGPTAARKRAGVLFLVKAVSCGEVLFYGVG
jgi:hypothetical protein